MKFVLCRCTACNGLFCQTKKRKKRLGKSYHNKSFTTSYEVLVILITNANKAHQQKSRLLLVALAIYHIIFFAFILDIKFVGRTSRGHREEGHTGFFLIHLLLSAVRALIFLARKIQPLFLSLSSTVKSNFVY